MDNQKAPREEERIMSYEKYEMILEKQVGLLSKWNEENIDSNPEQVRKNSETIINITQFLYFDPNHLRSYTQQ